MEVPLSYSQLSSYRSCPRKYEYEFIKKLPKALSPEQCFGISMHSVLSKWGKEEMRKCDKCENTKMQKQLFEEIYSPVHETELTFDALLALWQQSFVTAGYDTLVAADFDRKRGEKLLGEFYEWWKKEERKVIGIEKGFKISIDSASIRPTVSSRVALRAAKGVSRDASTGSAQAWATPAFAEASVGRQHDTLITGRFDRVEELPDGTLRIIDFKTSRIRNQSEVDQDLQLSVYALAGREELKKEVSQLTMLFLVDESLTEVVTRRGEGELNTAAKTIELLSERVLSGDYTPTPSKEKCRGCPYRRICDASASP